MSETTVAELVSSTGPILLDFDGPVTRLLPPPANAEIAQLVRQPLLDAGIVLPASITQTTDHIAILRFAGTVGGEPQARVEGLSVAAEVGAARRSDPTPGVVETLQAARQAHRPVALVSNNHRDALETFLTSHALLDYVHSVFGRVDGAPELMKPDPHVLKVATRVMHVNPDDCLLIGDSVSDVEAGRAAGIKVLGFAKSAQRAVELQAAGAQGIVTDMRSVAAALSTPDRP
jgi:phosphoglycolate phosphatase